MAPDPDHSAAGDRGGGGDLMERAVDGAIRLGRAWKGMTRERRVAVVAAGVLWLTLFLPWYQASVVGRKFITRGAAPVSESLSGWASFGLAQALILIASLGVIGYVFLRAEGRARELPGGDGWVVTGAGALSVLLVILGLFSAPSPATHGGYVVSTGLEWGIFLALVAAGTLTWAGNRIRHSLEGDEFLAANRRVAAPEPEARTEDEPPTSAGPASEQPKPVPAEPQPEPAAGSDGAEAPTKATPAEAPTQAASRSDWRPAERPEWTDPERPVGWLTARSEPPEAEDEDE